MTTSVPVLFGISGNRGFFPERFAREGAVATAAAVQRALGDTVRFVDLGIAETWADAKRIAAMAAPLRRDAEGHGAIGIIVSMYNFSDEIGVRDALRLIDQPLPVLIHTEPDSAAGGAFGQTGRRDGACGRFSACNALKHLGLRYTLTRGHVSGVDSADFSEDLRAFLVTCRIATRFDRRGRGVRLGLIGNGPDAFQTVTTVSTELLGHLGLSTVGMDLLTLDRRMRACTADDTAAEVARVRDYLPAPGMPAASAEAIARMSLVFGHFLVEHELDGLAVRCWTEMQEQRIGGGVGISPCTSMSRLLDRMVPAACEVDIAGWVGMEMLRTATGLVPSLGDWNNMRSPEAEDVDLFHCGVWAKSVLRPGAKVTSHEILGRLPGIGAEHAWGTVDGELVPGACAFLRPCTDSRDGTIFCYSGTGEVLPTSVATFGTRARVRIPGLPALLRELTRFERAVEHHVPVVVGEARHLGIALRGIADAVPYLNQRIGRNRHGVELVEWWRHPEPASIPDLPGRSQALFR